MDLYVQGFGQRTRGACMCKTCRRLWGPLKKRGKRRARRRLKRRLREKGE